MNLYPIHPCSCGLLLTAVVLSLAAGVASADEPASSPLPGKVVGILVGDARAIGLDEGDEQNAAVFVEGKGPPRRLYVPASPESPDKTTIFVAVGKDGKKRQSFPDVELLRRPLLKKLGLKPGFQLVEVEVNGGAGCPATPFFVASSIKVLDNTRDFPPAVGPTVSKVRKGFVELLGTKTAALDVAFEAAQKAAIDDEKPNVPREAKDGVSVTWLPAAEAVQVEVTRRITSGMSSRGEGIRPREAGLPGGRPFGVTFGVEAKVIYTLKKTGEVSASELTITPIRSGTPPPRRAFQK
ncbi:MAG: hypothetical protein ACRC33_05400 [Gemmataceae bacterium]